MTVGTDKALVSMTEPAARSVAGLSSAGLGLVCNTFEDVWRMSQIIAKSGFVPKGITTPEQVSVQIMMGMEVGLRPMVAVQNIAVINNKAAIPGDLALAILLTSGLLEEHEEGVRGEGDDRVGFCIVKRKGMKGTIERTFSVADAKKAGLWETQPTVRKSYYDKAKGQRVTSNYDTPNDSPWWKYQDRMLVMRARGFSFRDRFSDVLKGMHLSEEFTGHNFEDAEFEHATVAGLPTSGPSAPVDEIEEGEIVAAQAQAPRRESAPFPDGASAGGATVMTPEASQAMVDQTRAAVYGSEVSGDPTDDQSGEQEEPFDAEAWILERRVDFNQAADATVVDQIHEMFGDTAETMLNMTQREVYAAAHQEAIERTKAKPGPISLVGPSAPVDDEAGDFPGNSAIDALRTGQSLPEQAADTQEDEDDGFTQLGREFDDKLRAYLEMVNRTPKSIIDGFNSHTAEMAAMIADGEVPETYEAEIRATFRTEYDRLKAAAAAGGADPAEAMTQRMREGLAGCKSTEDVNAFSLSTLPDRNAFGKRHPLYDTWKDMVAEARKSHSAIA